MKKVLIACFAVLLSVNAFAGDIIQLNNGMRFDGEIVKVRGCEVKFKADNGRRYWIPAEDIATISFENAAGKGMQEFLEAVAQDDTCILARMDAEQFHGKEVGHIALGFFFGLFAVIGTALTNVTPEKGKLTPYQSENTDLFDDPVYLDCYKKSAKAKLIKNELIGWGASIVLSAILGGLDNG